MATLVAPEDFSPGEDALAINRACQGTFYTISQLFFFTFFLITRIDPVSSIYILFAITHNIYAGGHESL